MTPDAKAILCANEGCGRLRLDAPGVKLCAICRVAYLSGYRDHNTERAEPKIRALEADLALAAVNRAGVDARAEKAEARVSALETEVADLRAYHHRVADADFQLELREKAEARVGELENEIVRLRKTRRYLMEEVHKHIRQKTPQFAADIAERFLKEGEEEFFRGSTLEVRDSKEAPR